MKKIIITVIAIFGMHYAGSAAMRNARNVPDDVLKAFSAQYPQVAVEKWKVVNDTFIAEFKEDKRKDMAWYAADGAWVKTETKLPWMKDLPCAVDYSFDKTAFRSWNIDYMAQRESPTEKELYVIQVHKDDGPDGSIPGDCRDVYKLYYDANGDLLRKKVIQ
jgi:Putative beta-lactamase-inhibitor-like, PepSY-like